MGWMGAVGAAAAQQQFNEVDQAEPRTTELAPAATPEGQGDEPSPAEPAVAELRPPSPPPLEAGRPMEALEGPTGSAPRCLRCQSPMERGWLAGYLPGGGGPSTWVSDDLELRRLWTGQTVPNLTSKKLIASTTYRCTRCGYLESYARSDGNEIAPAEPPTGRGDEATP